VLQLAAGAPGAGVTLDGVAQPGHCIVLVDDRQAHAAEVRVPGRPGALPLRSAPRRAPAAGGRAARPAGLAGPATTARTLRA